MTDEESQATPTRGPTDDATAPVRETEQEMETEGDGEDSPVTPNEDDLLMGASAAEVGDRHSLPSSELARRTEGRR